MTRVSPWHSTRESDRKVYHDSDKCTEGNNIEAKYRKAGTDGRPRARTAKSESRSFTVGWRARSRFPRRARADWRAAESLLWSA